MASLFDYIALMEAGAVDPSIGNGIVVFPLCTGGGTATCGVVGIITLPAPEAEASGNWAPIGLVTWPAMDSTGTTDGYRPAWGDPAFPAMTGDGTAHVNIESVSFLPSFYTTGSTGAVGAATIPSPTAYGLDEASNRTASGAMTLPVSEVEAYVCGLDKPIDNGATSSAIVALLQQGNTTIADAAASICSYDDTDDERVISVTYFVSNLLQYVQDGDGIGDRWTCALATWLRRYGDCEDGAILIHALLLAAGVNPGRLRTAFGTILTSALTTAGHAWCMYRRESDEEWIPLEWTIQPTVYTATVDQINRQLDLTATYTEISYILTDERFSAVDDADYISKLEANRSTASMSLPVPTATVISSRSALGDMALFKGPVGLTMTASGRCGSHAAMMLPSVAVAAAGKQTNEAMGDMALPASSAVARTGAHTDCALPVFAISGGAGGGGHVAITFPKLTTAATAASELLAEVVLKLPKPTVAARAGVGVLCDGVCALPVPRSYGRAAQGPVAHALLGMPHLVVVDAASPLSDAAAGLSLPIPLLRGHAISAAPWAQDLAYDSTRLT